MHDAEKSAVIVFREEKFMQQVLRLPCASAVEVQGFVWRGGRDSILRSRSVYACSVGSGVQRKRYP